MLSLLCNQDYRVIELVKILDELISNLDVLLLEVPSLTEANIAARLNRMLQLGHVETYLVPSDRFKGVSKKYYRITTEGEDLLASIQDLHDRVKRYGKGC